MVAENGDLSIDTSPQSLPVEVMSEATLKDIRRAVLEISADLAAQAASQYFKNFIQPDQVEQSKD
jgi:patatin-like phospholipase/acyl hydrolase